MTATIERIFLGWDTPALPNAAGIFADYYAADAQLPMADAVIALPGARAGRRLLELLVEQAEQRGLQLIPPRIVTLGALPELLYEPALPLADALTARRAWSMALKQLSADQLAMLSVQRPADAAAWDAVGRLLQQLHEDLAAEGLDFADVPDRARDMADFTDAARWSALAETQRIYRRILTDAGCIDPHDARWRAMVERQCRCPGDLWLVGVAQINGRLRRIIRTLDTQVRVLIHAPPSLADRFDEFGAVLVDAWRHAEVDLDDENLRIAARPVDQASEALQRIGELNAAYPAEQITLGVCDDRVAPHLQQQLETFGLPARYAAGLPMSRTAVYRLLETLAEFLGENRFSQFAALIRHPDLTDWLLAHAAESDQTLQAMDDWADLLDRYYNDHLQARLAGRWLDGPQRDRMAALWRLVHDNLFARFSNPRLLREWVEVVTQFLLEIYGSRSLNPHDPSDRLTLESMQLVAQLLQSLAHLPASLDESVSASEAFGVILRQLADKAVPPEPLDPAVEMLGWLELHLDDAPVLIVTGFNEGSLPQSVNADAFLPDSLRTVLGLINNDRRYARDSYQMSAILHSRPVVRWICGRQSAQGDPLTPSRLMFAADPKIVAQRVLKFYRDDPDVSAPIQPDSRAATGGFILPPRPSLQLQWSRNYLSVTDFRAYLDDPYRFALARILELEDIADAAAEMDGRLFGQLAHEVLYHFGRGDLAASTDADEIRKFLIGTLDELVGRRFGSDPQPAVRIQLAQLQARLAAFAEHQARRTADGWTIYRVEESFTDERALITVDGQPMYLHGRIDRIDYHPERKQWAIFDYKTSEAGESPEQSHQCGPRNAKRWIDLQLPLYRHLFASLVDADGQPLLGRDAIDDPQRLQLGYVLLPRDTMNVGFQVAAWTAADLRSADDAAAEVVRGIRSGHFEFDPNRRPRFADFDPFAALCGSDQITDADDSDEQGGDS